MGVKKVGLLTILAIVSYVFVGNISLAEEREKQHTIDVWVDKCMEKAESDQQMVDCAVKNYQMWDKELNKVYKELFNKLDTKERELLKKSQHKWIEFRDAEFEFIDELYNLPGLLNVVWRYGWKVEIVRERALRLEKYLNDISKK